MGHFSKPKYLLGLSALLAIGVTSIGWTGNHGQNGYEIKNDTVPGRQKSIKSTPKKDLDKELEQIDKAMKDIEHIPSIDMRKIQAEIEASLSEVSEQLARKNFELEKMHKEIAESMKKIDLSKMEAELKIAMSEIDKIDFSKMEAEIKAAMKEVEKIDKDKMKKDIERAMEDVRSQLKTTDIQRQVEESLRKIDFESMRKEMERAKEDMERNKENMKVDMEKARRDMDRAKEELKGWQQMLEIMKEDGLISRTEDYKIQYKDGELFINYKKQSETVTNKYKKYFKENTTIRKEDGEMNINIQ